MPSFYRVLRYYPDLVTGECINVGVIAFDERRVLTRTLKDWSRVVSFACGDFDPEWFQARMVEMGRWTPQQAKGFESHYMSCLVLGEPLASITTVYSLLDRIGDRMLVEP